MSDIIVLEEFLLQLFIVYNNKLSSDFKSKLFNIFKKIKSDNDLFNYNKKYKIRTSHKCNYPRSQNRGYCNRNCFTQYCNYHMKKSCNQIKSDNSSSNSDDFCRISNKIDENLNPQHIYFNQINTNKSDKNHLIFPNFSIIDLDYLNNEKEYNKIIPLDHKKNKTNLKCIFLDNINNYNKSAELKLYEIFDDSYKYERLNYHDNNNNKKSGKCVFLNDISDESQINSNKSSDLINIDSKKKKKKKKKNKNKNKPPKIEIFDKKIDNTEIIEFNIKDNELLYKNIIKFINSNKNKNKEEEINEIINFIENIRYNKYFKFYCKFIKTNINILLNLNNFSNKVYLDDFKYKKVMIFNKNKNICLKNIFTDIRYELDVVPQKNISWFGNTKGIIDYHNKYIIDIEKTGIKIYKKSDIKKEHKLNIDQLIVFYC